MASNLSLIQSSPSKTLSLPDPFYFLNKFRYDFKEVPCYSEVRLLEYRGVRVFIYRHYEFGCPHPCYVLWGAGDSAGYVELRGDGLSGLSHLTALLYPPAVHGAARCRYHAAEG